MSKEVRMVIHLAPDYKIGDPDTPPPWVLRSEIYRFMEETTVPHVGSRMKNLVVLSRKTWEQTPPDFKSPKGGRRFVVLSRKSKELEGCLVASSVEQVFDLAQPDESIWVIGGKSVFENFFEHCEMLHLVKWDCLPVRTFLRPPEISVLEWNMTGAGHHKGRRSRVYSKAPW